MSRVVPGSFGVNVTGLDYSSAGASRSNGSLMGINADDIPGIQNAIGDYLNVVNATLEEINAETVNVNQAFKGVRQVATITTYLEESVATIKGVTTELQKFSDDLSIIMANYAAKDESITVQAMSDEGLTVDTGVNPFGG